MGNFWIAFLAGVGAGGWVYSKVQRRTGAASTKNSLVTAGFSGLAIFVILWVLLELLV